MGGGGCRGRRRRGCGQEFDNVSVYKYHPSSAVKQGKNVLFALERRVLGASRLLGAFAGPTATAQEPSVSERHSEPPPGEGGR